MPLSCFNKVRTKKKKKSLVSSPSHVARTGGTSPFNKKKCVMHEWPVCTDGVKVAANFTLRPKPGPLLKGQQWKSTSWSETVGRLTLQWVPPLAPLLRVECRKFCAGWGATHLTHNHLADKCPPGKHLWISIKVSQAQLLNTWPVNSHLKNCRPFLDTYFSIYSYPLPQSCAMIHMLPMCAHFQHATNGQSCVSSNYTSLAQGFEPCTHYRAIQHIRNEIYDYIYYYLNTNFWVDRSLPTHIYI